MKMIQVEDRTHLVAKENAKMRGMTLQGYIKNLVNKDKEELRIKNDNC